MLQSDTAFSKPLSEILQNWKHQEKRQLNKALKPVFKGYTDKFLTSKQKYHVTLKK